MPFVTWASRVWPVQVFGCFVPSYASVVLSDHHKREMPSCEQMRFCGKVLGAMAVRGGGYWQCFLSPQSVQDWVRTDETGKRLVFRRDGLICYFVSLCYHLFVLVWPNRYAF